MSDQPLATFRAVPEGFRRNAGIALVAADGRVFAGQRTDRSYPAWQMPQGGIDGDEPVLDAALRELREETGVRSDRVEFLDQTEEWLTYELPAEVAARLWRGRYRGQAQKWVALRFRGRDADIDLDQPHPEFSAWRWMRTAELLALVVPFKQPVYRYVFERFAAHLAP